MILETSQGHRSSEVKVTIKFFILKKVYGDSQRQVLKMSKGDKVGKKGHRSKCIL